MSDKVLNKYTKVNKPIGEGTYGVVYKAKCNETGRLVALKKIKLEGENEGLPATTVKEISILQLLKGNRNIVELLDVHHSLNPPRLYLVFEWVDYDLKKYMDSIDGSMDPVEVQAFAFQLLLGLDFCHSRGVFHRDLKPMNILMKKPEFAGQKMILKIADFGLARVFSIPLRAYTHEVVTLWYRAPEVMLCQKLYGLPIDMWSVGTIIGEMSSRRKTPMFHGECEIDQLFKIFRFIGTPTDNTYEGLSDLKGYAEAWPRWERTEQQISDDLEKKYSGRLNAEGRKMLREMLQICPTKRLSCPQALRHTYFTQEPTTLM